MLSIHNLDSVSLRRRIKLNKIKGSVRYSSELLDQDIKRKLYNIDLMVKEILNTYLNNEAEERVNYWIKICYHMSWINNFDFNNIINNEKKKLMESLDLENYYKVLFNKLL